MKLWISDENNKFRAHLIEVKDIERIDYKSFIVNEKYRVVISESLGLETDDIMSELFHDGKVYLPKGVSLERIHK